MFDFCKFFINLEKNCKSNCKEFLIEIKIRLPCKTCSITALFYYVPKVMPNSERKIIEVEYCILSCSSVLPAKYCFLYGKSVEAVGTSIIHKIKIPISPSSKQILKKVRKKFDLFLFEEIASL